MATVMGSRVGSPGGLNSKRRVHSRSLLVRSPKSVLLPESLDSASESSSLASSILGEQIVECSSSFRMAAKVIKDQSCDAKAAPDARFEHVDSYTWFASIDRPSDLLVEVDDISFHLHKLPLLSRSGLLFRLASQSRDSRKAYINLVDVPGGAEAFMMVVKFCYGIVEELTPTNVATIRCCAEYLEMTEAFEEGNVVSKAEAYLNLVILNSWQESIIVLQSCELLLPWAEDMSLVKRCAQSVALKACTDPRGVRWLYSGAEKISSSASASPQSAAQSSRVLAPLDWWYEDVSHLTVYCLREVVDAIKEKGMDPVLLGGAVEHYAQRWLPGLGTPVNAKGTIITSAASTRRSSPMSSPRKLDQIKNCPSRGTTITTITTDDHVGDHSPTQVAHVDVSVAEQNKNRVILEEIVTMLPQEKDAISCSFLLRMTRAAYMLNCDADCKAELERQAGLQLDRGTLSDLLIPSFSHTSEYLYDIDIVRRILDQFLTQEQMSVDGSPRSCTSDRDHNARGVYDGTSKATHPALNLRTRVAKLLDSYLAEVARDCKLPLGKFQSLAEALPEGSRLCDDGLYRAVDTYLKIHPTLSEHERKRLCRILNCHRLSLDACTHASQNERLPLRFVVQVLFCEQLKIRSTVTEVTNSVKGDQYRSSNADNNVSCVSPREPVTGADSSSQPTASTSSGAATREAQALQESVNQMEIRALQRELATMRVKWNDLERDHGHIQEQVEQISRISSSRSSSWSSGAWKKITKLHLFNNHHSNHHHVPGDSGRTDESRTTIPRRWRNSIS